MDGFAASSVRLFVDEYIAPISWSDRGRRLKKAVMLTRSMILRGFDFGLDVDDEDVDFLRLLRDRLWSSRRRLDSLSSDDESVCRSSQSIWARTI